MADRPVRAVRRLVRRGRGERAQRSRGDGAGDRRRRRPARRVRMVLLKGHGPDGFVFYTNEQSARASSSPPTRAPRCCSTGSRCAGRCASKARSSACPTPRPTPISPRARRDSQLGAWASDQSRPLDSRETFEQRFDEVKRGSKARTCRARRTGAAIAWCPTRIEFWSDRPHRLHERRLFTARGRRLDRRTALPMTDRKIAAARSRPADRPRRNGEHRHGARPDRA